MDIQSLLVTVLSLAGVAGAIAVLVNLGKRFGLVKDGDAPTWVTGANLLVMIAVYVLKIFKPDFDIEGTDAQVSSFLAVFVPFLNFILDTWVSKLTHKALRGAAFVGTSHTLLGK